METHTTNIAELPTDHTPSSVDLPEHAIRSSSNHVIDEQIYQPVKQNVNFNPNVNVRMATDSYVLKDTNKMIILATLVFILFNEPLIRNYIMNILVVIFGGMLKTPTGTSSKVGTIFYGVTYALCIYIVTLMIDIPSISF